MTERQTKRELEALMDKLLAEECNPANVKQLVSYNIQYISYTGKNYLGEKR